MQASGRTLVLLAIAVSIDLVQKVISPFLAITRRAAPRRPLPARLAAWMAGWLGKKRGKKRSWISPLLPSSTRETHFGFLLLAPLSVFPSINGK